MPGLPKLANTPMYWCILAVPRWSSYKHDNASKVPLSKKTSIAVASADTSADGASADGTPADGTPAAGVITATDTSPEMEDISVTDGSLTVDISSAVASFTGDTYKMYLKKNTTYPMDKCSWEKLAWWSKKSLMQWFDDLLKRHKQLTEWTMEMSTPLCIWISGLFNPTAFNTAIMQVTARRKKSIFL